MQKSGVLHHFCLWFCALALVFSSCTKEKTTTEIVDLKCEYLTNPIGVDVTVPRLSWKMKSDKRGAAQSAYRICVATNEQLLQSNTPDLWDSGKINSDQSIQIEYKGNPLQSGMKVFWKVQVWDEKGKDPVWSPVASWEMGLLNKADWQAKWISSDELDRKAWKLPSPLFRKEADLQKKIKKARVYISGLGYYELYINGEKVGDHQLSPNQTNYDRRVREKWDESRVGDMTTTVLYETFDITPYLKQGTNAFGVWLGNGWYIQADRSYEPHLWYDTPRFIAQFDIEFEDGTHDLITSDESWLTSLSPIQYNGLHTGEIYDARLEQPGWNISGFDASKWKSVIAVRPPTGKLKSQQSAPDRITRTIKPVSLTKIEKGVYRFDLGEMISGWARLKISGERGTKIVLRYKEEAGPTYAQTDTYILKGGGIEIWNPRFTWHAFRYVEVQGAEAPLTTDNLEGLVVNTDVQRAGSFECSDSLLNHILRNYQSTQLGNMHGGIPSDCPHRERRGYTGDGQISARSAIYNFDMAAFYTKWMNDIRDAQNHTTGYVPNTTPYQDGGGGTAWGSAYVIIPWYMYLYYGDTRILEEHYNGMKHWIEFMKNSLGKDGILRNQGLGEWVPPEAVEIPIDLVNTAYYFHCCNLMQNVAKVLAKNTDETWFKDLAETARKDIHRTWFDAKSSEYSIGRQGANAIPLDFGITKPEDVKAVFKNLIENLLKNKVHFDTGILATPLLPEILTEMGRVDLAWTLMAQRDFPSYGYMIENGASTLWETWQGDASHSHPMFGSVCQWFYQQLGGISPDPENPGFKQSIIKPFPVRSLDFVNTSYPTPYGTIASNWKFEGDDLMLEVTIPANTKAMVFVPAEEKEAVSESGTKISRDKNVQFLHFEGNYSVYLVNSGHYKFYSKNARKLLQKSILPAPVIHPDYALVDVGDSIRVTMTAATPKAKIYYTLDGKEPDAGSIHYTTPFYVTEKSKIKATAFAADFLPGYTQTAEINFVDPKTNGLTFHYYEGKWTSLPDFSKLTEKKSGTVYEFGLDDIHPEKDEFALVFEGKIKIDREGDYEFYINSNDGSRLYINKRLVVDNDGPHGADQEKSGKIHLEKGTHPIRLNYFQAGGGLFLRVRYAGPGIKKQDVPAMVLLRN